MGEEVHMWEGGPPTLIDEGGEVVRMGGNRGEGKRISRAGGGRPEEGG